MVNAKSKIVNGRIITVILDVTTVCAKQVWVASVLLYLLDILQGYVVYDGIPVADKSNYNIIQCVTFRPIMRHV